MQHLLSLQSLQQAALLLSYMYYHSVCSDSLSTCGLHAQCSRSVCSKLPAEGVPFWLGRRNEGALQLQNHSFRMLQCKSAGYSWSGTFYKECMLLGTTACSEGAVTACLESEWTVTMPACCKDYMCNSFWSLIHESVYDEFMNNMQL